MPGEQILVLPGTYQGNLWSSTLQGTAAQPIVIRAADPNQIPVIQGGTDEMYLSSPSYVVLQHLILSGATSTGILVRSMPLAASRSITGPNASRNAASGQCWKLR